MIQYKLIKEYPGSLKLGTIVGDVFLSTTTSKSNFPEFYEKVEELDYEILEFFNKMNKRVYHFDKASKSFCSIDGFHNNVNYNYCIEYYDIKSVKNLYDGEVFTIGDKVKSKRLTDDDSSPITKIYINNNRDAKPVGGLIIQTGGYYQAKINEITKVKTPLFTTEDGVEIFEGDYYWIAYNDFSKHFKSPCAANFLSREYPNATFFSSEEKAEEYVLLNKPCLSLQDLLCARANAEYTKPFPFFKELEELAKSKL